MSLIDTLLSDVARHESDLVRRLEELRSETKDVKHMLGEVQRHRKRLERDRSGGTLLLPLEDATESDATLDDTERELDEAEDAGDEDMSKYWDVERDGAPESDPTDGHTTDSIAESERTGMDLVTSQPAAVDEPVAEAKPSRRKRKGGG